MKNLFTIFCSIAIFICISSNSFSIPLNGTYTIGSGGDYPTINSAAIDVAFQGVSGPVIFNILNGTYQESVALNSISGSSSINTVTFKSQTGNPQDVIIEYYDFVLNGANNVIIKSIFFSALSQIIVNGIANNIRIEENLFNLERRPVTLYSVSNAKIINNTFFSVSGSEVFWQYSIHAENCDSLLIEKNNFTTGFHIEAIQLLNCNLFYISKNKFSWGSGGCNQLYLNSCGNPITPSVISNNFFTGTNWYSPPRSVVNCTNLLFIYNSFSGRLPINYQKLVISSSTDITLINNLYIKFFINFINNTTLSSDYNNYYDAVMGYNGIDYNNVFEFYNATGLDEHSNSHRVNFVSTTDLHLTGLSIGDEELIGIPSSIITDDIDGEPRDPFFPYKGADEADVVLPVELSSFTSTVVENDVKLNWITMMESNNSGFGIERLASRSGSNVTDGVTGEWSMMNFVRGIGNSNTPQNYSYEDRNLSPGKYKYRLKQIDFNGNYKYYELSNGVLIGVPEKFSLSQNYPNPFNPVTVIRLSAEGGENRFITLKVFDILGNEVAILINEKKEAGIYSVQFDGSNLSSGVYLYRLKADGIIIDTKRMVLLK